MKKLLLLICLNFIVLTCCFGQTDIYDSIFVGNVWRKYNIHLPLGYNSNTNYPLILGFHGGQQGTASSQGWNQFAYQSNLSAKSDSSGFIVVYPEGLVINQNRSWNAGNCCPPAMNQNFDDVGFVDNLLDTLFSIYSIDTARAYATGYSNGGMFCYRLACELSHRIAAIAPVACSQMFYPCNPIHKVPVISFHSKVDPIVYYTGGNLGFTNIYLPSQDSTMKFWSQKNNCQTRDTIMDGNGTNYDFVKISNCSCNVEIHHYATTDGSHSWPGGNPTNNPVSTQISATDLLWEFFKKYTLDCNTTGVKDGNEEINSIKIYPNPTNTYLNIQGYDEMNKQYSIISVYGQLLKSGMVGDGRIDISHLPIGLYFIQIGNYTERFVVVR